MADEQKLPLSFDVRVKGKYDDYGKLMSHTVTAEIVPDFVNVKLGELVTVTINKHKP